MRIAGFPYSFGAATSFYPMACIISDVVFPASTAWCTVSGVNTQTYADIVASIDNAAISNVQMDAAGSVFVAGTYFGV